MRSFSNYSINNSAFVKSLIIGVVSSVAMITVLLCIVTVVLLVSALLPYEYLQYIMLAVDGIGVLFGAYIAGRMNKSQGLLLGLSIGFIVFVALTIVAFATVSGALTLTTLLKAIVLLIFSCIGAVKGVNAKEKIHIK